MQNTFIGLADLKKSCRISVLKKQKAECNDKFAAPGSAAS